MMPKQDPSYAQLKRSNAALRLAIYKFFIALEDALEDEPRLARAASRLYRTYKKHQEAYDYKAR